MLKKITENLLNLLLIMTLLLLQACATKERPVGEMKIGMHIDAVLEFAVEYPLAWSKDRRLSYGSGHGEVRWTNNEDKDVLLRIFSVPGDGASEDTASWLRKALPEHPRQTVLSRGKVDIPAGEALHLRINTSDRDMDVYFLSANNRKYTIVLLAPVGAISAYDSIMNKIVESFTLLPATN